MDQMPFTNSSNSWETTTKSMAPSTNSNDTNLTSQSYESGGKPNEEEPTTGSIESNHRSAHVSENSSQLDVVDNDNTENQFIWHTLKLIDSITGEAENLRKKVENFSGSSTDDKEYIYLEEMLIRAIVELDNIETRGNPLLRQERKKAVHYIQKLMKILDARLKENKRYIVSKSNSCSDSEDGL